MTRDLDFLRAYLAANRDRWTQISNQAEVARRAIAYIVENDDRDPRYSTFRSLLDWIEKHDPEGAKAVVVISNKGRKQPSAVAKAAT